MAVSIANSTNAETNVTPQVPRVSVIMPVQDGEDNVESAVNSIRGQTLQDFELIIVNDGSTDSTARILSKVAEVDDRIRVVNQPPRGVAMALEAGIAVSTGAYIARMDSDDLAMPNRLELQAAFLDENEEVVAVGGQVRHIDGHGVTLRRGYYPTDSQSCHDHLRFGAPFSHPAVTVRRAALQLSGGYRKRFEPAEDYDLWLRLSQIGKLANLDQDVLYYRIHGQGVTNKRAVDMARAAAMALCEHTHGKEIVPATWDQLHKTGISWNRLEAKLKPSLRLTSRATFLRGLILNGAILDDEVFSILVTSLPEFSRRGPNEIAPDILAFMILRAAFQNFRGGKMIAALKILLLGFRHVPMLALLRDIKSSAMNKAHSLHVRRFKYKPEQGPRQFEPAGPPSQSENK